MRLPRWGLLLPPCIEQPEDSLSSMVLWCPPQQPTKAIVGVICTRHPDIGTCRFRRRNAKHNLSRGFCRRGTTMESLSLVKSAVAEIISTANDDSLKRLALVLEQLCSVVDEVERVARDAMEEARRATRAARK